MKIFTSSVDLIDSLSTIAEVSYVMHAKYLIFLSKFLIFGEDIQYLLAMLYSWFFVLNEKKLILRKIELNSTSKAALSVIVLFSKGWGSSWYKDYRH